MHKEANADQPIGAYTSGKSKEESTSPASTPFQLSHGTECQEGKQSFRVTGGQEDIGRAEAEEQRSVKGLAGAVQNQTAQVMKCNCSQDRE